MLFHTPEFILLLICTLGLYYLLPKGRLYLLAAADIIFYGVTGLGYLALFVLITSLTYFLSLKSRGPRGKLYLGIGLAINILNLCFFKYSLFILTNLERVLPVQLVNNSSFFTSIVLPIGISFYTFQFIAYLVDVYQGKTEPARSLLVFWVFISFFAHLIAGPIMRGQELIPQVQGIESIKFDPARFRMGVAYFALGLLKKIILADYIAIYADRFFNQGSSLTGPQAWVAAYLFAFQIYFDFSAYSEMAVGIGHMFGIRLHLNFRTPYLSANPGEFWRRWHITLSNWIRDYIYIPLGGSRQGETRKYVNLFIAMTVSGLWHGAAWTFVLWGMYHGLLLVIYNLYRKALGVKEKTATAGNRLVNAISVLVFFQFACIGWVFFRASSIDMALHMLRQMLALNHLYFDPSLTVYIALIAGLYLLHVLEYWVRQNYLSISYYWHRYLPASLRALVYTTAIILLIAFSRADQSAFIYFKF